MSHNVSMKVSAPLWECFLFILCSYSYWRKSLLRLLGKTISHAIYSSAQPAARQPLCCHQTGLPQCTRHIRKHCPGNIMVVLFEQHTGVHFLNPLYLPSGEWGIAGGCRCALGQQVPPLWEWPASHLGLVWYLGQQDWRTCVAAFQHSIWETYPEGE